MPRIPELTPETASPEIREMMLAQEAHFGFVFNPTKVMGHCPEIAKAQVAMGRALDESGNIEPSLRYLVYTKVAAMNGCPF